MAAERAAFCHSSLGIDSSFVTRHSSLSFMLTELQLRNFRCFESLGLEFAPGFNFFIAQNGQGKTSILEAACVLLRLQSQRSSTLAPVVRFGEKAFGVSGRVEDHRLEFRYSALRRRVSLDAIGQRHLGA